MIFSLSFSVSFCPLFQEIPQFYILIPLWIIYFTIIFLISWSQSFFGASCLCFMDVLSYNYFSEDSYCFLKYILLLSILSLLSSEFLFFSSISTWCCLSWWRFISTIWWSFAVPSYLRVSYYKDIWKLCVNRRSLSIGGLYYRTIRWGPIFLLLLGDPKVSVSIDLLSRVIQS